MLLHDAWEQIWYYSVIINEKIQNGPLKTGQMVTKLDCADFTTSIGKRNQEWDKLGKR